MSWGYNNDRRNGGWNQGGWGRPQGGYRDGGQGGGRGWDNGPGFGGGRQFRFDIGQKVIHSATGIELSVINYGREQLECRKPDLNTIWCYEHELEPLTNEGGNQQ